MVETNRIVDEGKKIGTIDALKSSYGYIISNEKKYIFMMEDVNRDNLYNLHVGDSVTFIGQQLNDEDDIAQSAIYVKKIEKSRF